MFLLLKVTQEQLLINNILLDLLVFIKTRPVLKAMVRSLYIILDWLQSVDILMMKVYTGYSFHAAHMCM